MFSVSYCPFPFFVCVGFVLEYVTKLKQKIFTWPKSNFKSMKWEMQVLFVLICICVASDEILEYL